MSSSASFDVSHQKLGQWRGLCAAAGGPAASLREAAPVTAGAEHQAGRCRPEPKSAAPEGFHLEWIDGIGNSNVICHNHVASQQLSFGICCLTGWVSVCLSGDAEERTLHSIHH